MIEFIKPNKSKLKLSLLLIVLFFIFYVFQALAANFLKQYSSTEFENLISIEESNDLNQEINDIANLKQVNGDDISSLHFKYVAIEAILSFVFVFILSYFGACFVHKKWTVMNS